MRKYNLIWVFALFLLALPLVNAFTDYNNSLYNKSLLINHLEYNWSIDNSTYKNYANVVNGIIVYDNSTCISGGCINFSEANSDYIRHPVIDQWAIGNGNFTIIAWVRYNNPVASKYIVRRGIGTDANSFWWLVTEGCTYDCITFSTPNAGVQGTIATAGKGWQMLVGYYNNTDTTNRAGLMINSTYDGSGAGTSINQNTSNVIQISGKGSAYLFTGQIDEVMWFNDTLTFDEIQFIYNLTKDGGKLQNYPSSGFSPQDTTPPEINTNSYNMTSEGGEGCINWRTDKSNPCSTGDTTPTVSFTTNEPASCAIGTQNINFSDYNNLGVNKNCTIGQDTISHTCTLVEQDELVYDTSYIYISCKDLKGNQNSTSTSGALSLNITGLESAARGSIELGIKNSLSSGYIIYTDQRVYARNSANTQSTGRFDKIVKKFSKIWAFNRIGPSDSHVNTFNITPIFYNLEFANKTSIYIENETALLINATK